MSPAFHSWTVRSARLLLALSLIVFGAQHLALGAFVTRLVPSQFGAISLPSSAAYGVGALLLLGGVFLGFGIKTRTVALIFALGCVASLLSFHLLAAMNDIAWGGSWTAAGKAASFAALGLLIARTSADGKQTSLRVHLIDRPFMGWVPAALFGAFLILCGLQHFVWSEFVKSLVPSWVGAPLFWTYASAVLLIATGLGIMFSPTRATCAAVVGTTVFLWVWMLHVPRALSLKNANETTAVFEALSFAGLGWLLAAEALRQSSLFASSSVNSPTPRAQIGNPLQNS